MAYVFYLLGLLALVVGLGWTALIVGNAAGGASPAILIAAVPGVSVAATGLLFLAIGSALDALRRIARNTADTADAVEALTRQQPG